LEGKVKKNLAGKRQNVHTKERKEKGLTGRKRRGG
jgi:hypothetical protein